MKVFAVATLALLTCAWFTMASATAIPTHSRHVEYKITEPCGIEVATGEIVLEWADCSGAYVPVNIEVAGYEHPLSLLFYAGAPDFSTLDEHAYTSFFCYGYGKKKPNVYCQDCNPCDWYRYYTEDCTCGELVCIRAYMPHCMVLDITNVY
jgi:hypothetical protein